MYNNEAHLSWWSISVSSQCPWYWYWYRLPGLSPTPLNATLCHRGDPLSCGHVFLLLFLSNSSSPYPLEGMLAERPFSIRLVSVGLSAVSADRYESMSLPSHTQTPA